VITLPTTSTAAVSPAFSRSLLSTDTCSTARHAPATHIVAPRRCDRVGATYIGTSNKTCACPQVVTVWRLVGMAAERISVCLECSGQGHKKRPSTGAAQLPASQPGNHLSCSEAFAFDRCAPKKAIVWGWAGVWL
jgi:hypothetical protein